MNSQEQKATENALAIQSGRDTVIQQGLTSAQMKEILDGLGAQMKTYIAVAREIVHDRLAEFEIRVLERFGASPAEQRQQFAEPDFQYAVTRAQLAYARTGNTDLLNTLVDMIDERSKHPQRSRLTLTLNSCLEIAADLTENEFAELSLVFVLRYCRHLGVGNLEQFVKYIREHVLPFVPLVSFEDSSYQYLEAKQCASIGLGTFNFLNGFRANYAGIFQRGFTMDELYQNVPEDQQSGFLNHPLLIPCLNDPSKLQFKALSKDDLVKRLLEAGTPDPTAQRVGNLFEGGAWDTKEIADKLATHLSDFGTLQDTWEKTPLQRLTLTSLGIAIGYCNAKRKVASWAGELSIWIR